ncbi:MAG: polysaccharide biosynthesis/export family protein [Maritimibacter harenae]
MRILILLNFLVTLTACSGVGTPVVIPERTAAGEVEIVMMTANSVDAANASRYEPRTLPAIFARTTGTPDATRGLGALPAPVHSAQVRPGSLPTRLPPDLPPAPYRIGVGDVLVLSTPGGDTTAEALTGLLAAQNSRQDYTVQDDGAVSIPDVGRVELGGLTLPEAEARVFQAVLDAGFEPSFSLEISEFNAQRVTIGGAVSAPTVIPITLTPLRLSEVISQAGGITAAEREMATIRLYRDGALYRIPLSAYLEDTELRGLTLKDGDSLYVDTEYDLAQAEAFFREQITLRTTRFNARSTALDQLATEIGIRRAELNEARGNFRARLEMDAVARDHVYIAGEVGQQSRYTLPFERHATLADAIFDAGRGVPNESGNIGEVYVLRGTGDGRGIRAWHLDAYNAANLVLATRFELRPDDVIFVSEKPLSALSRSLTQIAAGLALVL